MIGPIKLVEKVDATHALLPANFIDSELWAGKEWRIAHRRVPDQNTVLSQNIHNDVVHGVKQHGDHTDNE